MTPRRARRPWPTPHPQGFSGTITAADDIIDAIDLAGTVYAISASSGITQWHATLLQDGPGGASLVFADDALYVGAGTGGTLFSLNAATGSVNWAREVDPYRRHGLPHHFQRAAAGLRRLRLLEAVVSPAGGAGTEGASPAMAGGQVYVCAGSELQSLDANSGKQIWSFALPSGTGFGSKTPAVADGLVFFGCDDNNLYAVRA